MGWLFSIPSSFCKPSHLLLHTHTLGDALTSYFIVKICSLRRQKPSDFNFFIFLTPNPHICLFGFFFLSLLLCFDSLPPPGDPSEKACSFFVLIEYLFQEILQKKVHEKHKFWYLLCLENAFILPSHLNYSLAECSFLGKICAVFKVIEESAYTFWFIIICINVSLLWEPLFIFFTFASQKFNDKLSNSPT